MQRLTEEPPAGGRNGVQAASAPVRVNKSRLTKRVFGLRAFLGRYALVFALIVLIFAFSFLRPQTFFTVAAFESILVTETTLVVLALGVTVALAAGEFDLSVAAVLGFSAGLVAHLTSSAGWPVPVALLLTFLAALLVGTTNGVFVTHFGVNSFITTIGMSAVITGLGLAVFGAETIGGVPSVLTDPLRKEFLGIGSSAFVALLLAAILWYFLEHTPSGRHVFFTGEGREAARLAGIQVNRIRLGALMASAVFAWLAGVMLVAQTGAAQGSYGQPFLLPAFAAGFLGATSIKPGRYNAWGTVIAVYLLAVGTTGVQLMGAATWVENVFNGAALILAVTLARLVSRER